VRPGASVTTLAQAYIHLKPYSASERKVYQLGRYAQRVAAKAAIDIYGGGVEIEVQIEEGSLVTRITVIGALVLSGVYSHIADYKGFKESIGEMCEDAREFAVDVCSPFVQKAGVSKDEIYRFERRLKTPGKLLRISRRLDKLQHSVNELSPRDVQKELASLRRELDAVTKDLSEAEKKAIETGLKRPKLPSPANWPAPEESKVAVRGDDEDSEQSVMFDEAIGAAIPPHKRRVVFKATSGVPKRKRKRGTRKKMPVNPDLLSSD
jgi:hypothetical protein